MGCPHCQRPVNAEPLRDEAMRVFVLRLAKLIERGKVAPAALAEKLRIFACDLYDDVERETSQWYPLWMLDLIDPEEDDEEAQPSGKEEKREDA